IRAEDPHPQSDVVLVWEVNAIIGGNKAGEDKKGWLMVLPTMFPTKAMRRTRRMSKFQKSAWTGKARCVRRDTLLSPERWTLGFGGSLELGPWSLELGASGRFTR